jgi:hypothetical protein
VPLKKKKEEGEKKKKKKKNLKKKTKKLSAFVVHTLVSFPATAHS